MKVIPILLIFSFLIIPVFSMGNISNERAGDSGNKWTFMVYMDADNSLSEYAPDDLAEMMSIGSNSNLTIIVMYDSQEYGDSGIYLIEKGKKELLKSLGEVDMGSENTLEYFLNYTIDNYPSEHYFLDFWDHGNYYGGVCIDHGDWLTLGEIKNALQFSYHKIGRKMDVVGFDACRMGGIEIFYSLKNYANYGVASEKDEPASGWPYDRILKNIRGAKPETAAKIVVDEMYGWAEQFYKDDGLSVTMAYVNLTRMDDFIARFNSDLNEAITVAPYYSKEIINNTGNVERYELNTVCDFYDFMDKISNVNDYKLLKLSRDTMRNLMNITYYKAWDCPNPANGYHATHAHGIGIYYPYYYVSSDYYRTSFARDTLWDEFLRSILSPTIISGYGNFNAEVKDGNLVINYTTNSSYVDIYIVNHGTIYSGILQPSGIFQVPVEYGKYKIYIYGYNSGNYVMWSDKKEVNYLRKITLKGKFYLNGKIAKGAKIKLISGNYSFTTIQGKDGFIFNLYYPDEIRDNTTLIIHVDYYPLSKNYIQRVGSLKSEEIQPVIIRENIFPDVEQLIFGTILITLFGIGVFGYIWRRR